MRRILCTVILFCVVSVRGLSICLKNEPENCYEIPYDPDMKRDVSGLISSKGYPVEEHVVQTADGYLLTLQRIPRGKNGISNGKAVLLQHGILSAASDWVLNFPHQSLGFILADNGYDVWLGNSRGNTYSRKHVKYSTDSKEFWDYSFHEMGMYDLPASIDYILNTTGQSHLSYVGHSQGTSSAFVMLSEKPEYNQKVKFFMAFAPVTAPGYVTSPLSYLAPFVKDLDFLRKLLGVNELLPNNAVIKFLSEVACETKLKFLCEDLLFLLSGTDSEQLNMTRIGVYISHTPAGSSAKSFLHYGQEVNSNKFCRYDYGKSGNMQHYNQTTPPEYDLSKIQAPVALAWSTNDKMADPTDVAILVPKLKSLVKSYQVPLPQFNHLDFIWGMDAKDLLYDTVLELIKQYDG